MELSKLERFEVAATLRAGIISPEHDRFGARGVNHVEDRMSASLGRLQLDRLVAPAQGAAKRVLGESASDLEELASPD